jgi:outer membrane autotransporter protein
MNIYKTVTSGNFNSSSIAATINGTLPGTTNRFATVDSGTTVGTFTNSVILNTLNNAGTITTLTNDSTIGTLNNGGTIGTLNILSGSSITNSILNLGSIGTLNFHKTLTNGDFSTSSLGGSIVGNQPGTTNLHATVNSGTTVGTFTNTISLNTLTNAGTITTLTNSGTLGTITNSGTIGTLNLLSGSTVTNGISNTGTINILNLTMSGITRGNYDVSVPGITGNQPITVNISGLPTNGHSYSVTRNGRRASVDVSGFGANNQAIRRVSNSVGRLVNTNGVIQSIGAKVAKHNADPYAMTSDLCADGAPTQPGQIGNSDFWIRGFTGRNKVDATASSTDYINTYSGGAIGIDRDWSDDVRGGVFIGSGNMNNSLGGGLGGTESDLIFAGTYATKTWGTLFAKVGLTGGRGSNTGTRNIAAGAPEIATADYKNWYVSPEVSVGKVYDLGQHLGGSLSVTPVLSVRYVYASQDGYTETGATNNLTMNKSHSTTIEERAELKFSYATKAFNDYGVKVNASVGGIGQQNNGGAMSGTLLGAPLSFATPGDDNSTGFVGGLGFEVNRGKYTFTASGDYVRLSGGNADLSANVVFSVKF